MFVNWAHYTIPKCSFVLSYIANPLFIYLIHNNNHVLLGPYRYLLVFFAVFNMVAALADLLVPVCVLNYRYACVTFLADGPFSFRSQLFENSISYRCSFISGTYAILNVHFLFRYLSLKRNDVISRYFMPYGLIGSVVYVIFHLVIWAVIDINFLYSTPEMRSYVRESFQKTYGVDIENVNFVAAVFSEISPDIIHRSWYGVLLLTTIASYSIILYFTLGYKIVTGIQDAMSTMSQRTAKMQKQLFKALTIQTVIPICVSFLPCSLSFYGAAWKIEFYHWVYWGATVAVSMFPFLDPLAIIFFLPALRRRLGFKIGRVSMVSYSAHDCGSQNHGGNQNPTISIDQKPYIEHFYHDI